MSMSDLPLWPEEHLDALRTQLQETGRVRLLGELLPVSLAHRLCDDLGIDFQDVSFQDGWLVVKSEGDGD